MTELNGWEKKQWLASLMRGHNTRGEKRCGAYKKGPYRKRHEMLGCSIGGPFAGSTEQGKHNLYTTL